MKTLNGHSGPRSYLDAQFTQQRLDATSKVVRSSPVGRRVYYAAVERIRIAHGERQVWAVVCLVRYNPTDAEGYIFAYNDMEESMGPYECDCPEQILDLLTPTDRQYALQWRARCRENSAARRAKARKPSPRPGQMIVFDEPLSFANGTNFARLEVVANPSDRGAVRFRAPGSSSLYRIPNIKNRAYRLVDPAGG